MSAPKRLKLAGRWFHYVIPDGAVWVGRNFGGLKRSPFHNPYVVGKPYTLFESRDLFRANVLPTLDLAPLRGFDLVCQCELDSAWCHGNDLLEWANR